jgi:2,4-dienoyl-CoA reductase-like NADH-dependent reductase (Old Yellow Enzyme family)
MSQTVNGHEDDKRLIFSPLSFRSLTVGNRIFRSSISGTFDNYDGSGTPARINWEEKFARGGVGAIISSFTPVHLRGRILTRYAMVDHDDKIAFWKAVGERVHRYKSLSNDTQGHPCRFIMQLSHSGRQQDSGGVENEYWPALSSTNQMDYFHGIVCRAMTREEIRHTVECFGEGARRAQEAGLDGVELHGANGYLITQFLSSGINDRRDEYGGSIENRARFVVEIVRAIRARVGRDFHLQMKINGVDHNDWLYPWEKKGNLLKDTVRICQILEQEGVDAFHVSSGSTFPHPRNPAGDFLTREGSRWYESMLSKGVRVRTNYWLFTHWPFNALFRLYWQWRRGPRESIPGINADYAAEIKKHVGVPVLCTGGFQTASRIAQVIRDHCCDAVSIARPLIANNDLPGILYRQDAPNPGKECTYCNRCLLNDLENPLGCYELSRFDGDYDEMMKQVMSVYHPRSYV